MTQISEIFGHMDANDIAVSVFSECARLEHATNAKYIFLRSITLWHHNNIFSLFQLVFSKP